MWCLSETKPISRRRALLSLCDSFSKLFFVEHMLYVFRRFPPELFVGLFLDVVVIGYGCAAHGCFSSLDIYLLTRSQTSAPPL